MSETLYTCDCCVRNGNDEASCHRAEDLCVIGTDVVCDGCRWEEYPYDAFVMPFFPPHEKRIVELEKQLSNMEKQYMEEKIEGDRLSEQLAELREALKIAISHMPPSMRLDIEQRINRETGEQ